jgi:hypothetical protein
MERRQFLTSSLAASAITLANRTFGGVPLPMHPRDYDFRQRISREVLDNYLLRAISMEGLLNGRGDLDDIRMLGQIGAKYSWPHAGSSFSKRNAICDLQLGQCVHDSN